MPNSPRRALIVRRLPRFTLQGIIWRQVAALIPVLGAWLISLTRITGKCLQTRLLLSWSCAIYAYTPHPAALPDGKHHGTDVAVGILIGTVAGTVGYLHYFYSPLSAYRGLPRCIRDTKGMPPHLVTADMQRPLIPPR